jgi:glycerol-3-phosphate acyltransferase PlsY
MTQATKERETVSYEVFIAGIPVAYLIGGIPFGVLIARAHGKDLRTIGSGNIGATNVARALSRKWGYVCFALDVLKGLIPMAAIRFIAGALAQADAAPMTPGLLALWLAVGCGAILGHVFPIYLRFRGGKGVATSFGVTLGLWPYFSLPALTALFVWLVVVLTSRYVSLASISASAAFPLALVVAILAVPAWRFTDLWPLLPPAAAIGALVVIRHRENIRRLLAGTESKLRGDRDGR